MSDDVISVLFEKLDTLGVKMDNHREMISDLQVGQTRIATQLSSQKPCPNPGLCLDIDSRLKAVEDAHAEQKGAWKVIIAVSSGVSAAIGLLINHFWGK